MMKTSRMTIISSIIIMTIVAMGSMVGISQGKSSQNITSNLDYIVLVTGCSWGAEKRMGEIPGVIDVESGYAGGDLSGVGYQQILNHEEALRAGRATARNHAEVIKVTFDPKQIPLETVLSKFWEDHNPTQG